MCICRDDPYFAQSEYIKDCPSYEGCTAGKQEREWHAHIARAKERGVCPHSGYSLARCRASICDCFDPYALDGDIHPEYFIVTGDAPTPTKET